MHIYNKHDYIFTLDFFHEHVVSRSKLHMVSLNYASLVMWIISQYTINIMARDPPAPRPSKVRFADTDLPVKATIIFERERVKTKNYSESGGRRQRGSPIARHHTEGLNKAESALSKGLSDLDSKRLALKSNLEFLLTNVQNMEAKLAHDIRKYRDTQNYTDELLESLKRTDSELRERHEMVADELNKCRLSLIAKQQEASQFKSDLDTARRDLETEKTILLNREKAVQSLMDEVQERQARLGEREEALSKREAGFAKQLPPQNPCVVHFVTCGKRRRFP